MSTIEQVVADLEIVKTAHEANVVAIKKSADSLANIQTVTLAEQAKVDMCTVAQAKALYEAQALATVDKAAAAVAAALLKSSLERLESDLTEYVPGAGVAGPAGPPGPRGPTGPAAGQLRG